MANGERSTGSIGSSSSERGKIVPKSIDDLRAMGYSDEQIDDWEAEGLVPLEEYTHASPMGKIDSEYLFRAHKQNGMEQNEEDEVDDSESSGSLESSRSSESSDEKPEESSDISEVKPDLLVDIDNSKDFLSNQFGERVLRVALVNQDADLEAVARFRGENNVRYTEQAAR